jgi:hypothetical protein
MSCQIGDQNDPRPHTARTPARTQPPEAPFRGGVATHSRAHARAHAEWGVPGCQAWAGAWAKAPVPYQRPNPQPVMGTPIHDRQIGGRTTASLGRCEFEGGPSTRCFLRNITQGGGPLPNLPWGYALVAVAGTRPPYPAPKLPGRGGGVNRIRTWRSLFRGGGPMRRPPWSSGLHDRGGVHGATPRAPHEGSAERRIGARTKSSYPP